MRTKDLTLLALLTAILVAAQLAFSMVLGINLVFPLFVIFAYNLGIKKTIIVMIAFNIIEFLIWGHWPTMILYFWTFSILILLAHLVNKSTKGNEYFAAGYTFVYFLLFGLMSAVQDFILTEVDFYIYWLQGAVSDLTGAILGFITTLVLLKPITKVLVEFVNQFSKNYT